MTNFRLDRRALFLGASAFLVAPPAKAAPYVVRLLWGGFDGAVYQGGLHVAMTAGWKTYWRVPGAGGIPPSLEGRGANVGSFHFDCPLPHRIRGEDGESIGYKDEVVFPFSLTPVAAMAPVEVEVAAFIGVCETICIPVQSKELVELMPVAMATRDAVMLAAWRALVPQRVDAGPVLSARAGEAARERFVELALAKPLRDLFIEGSALHFFNPPRFSGDGLSARVAVHGAKSVADLQAHVLRITIDDKGQGLEQTLTVG